LNSFPIFSSVLKEFLHNQTKYDINWNIQKINLKKLFLCHKIARIRIRIRIWIRILQKGLDPDPYNKYTDPHHWVMSWYVHFEPTQYILLIANPPIAVKENWFA